MKIHKEGFGLITFFFFLVVVILAAVNIIFTTQTPFHVLLYILAFFFLVFIIRFFRSPTREIKLTDNCICAPADGKIVVVEKVKEDEYFKDERIQVSIFMSAYNVHVNWYPVSGIVKYFKYHKGSYIIARHPKSSVKNERTSLVVETSDQKAVLIRQVAGLVARRIVSYSREGEFVAKGAELGFIKFGSRVDLFLPTDAKLHVELKQKVIGKQTILATLQ